MKNILIILLFMSIVGSSAGAVDLTIEKAEQMAISHSFELKKAKAKSESFRSNLSAAKAERYPNLSVEASALYNSEISSLDLELPGFSLNREIGQHEVYQTNLKISVPLYTGGKISSSVDIAKANYDIQKSLEQKSADEIKFMAKHEYLKLYKADKFVDAAKSSLKRTELVKKDIQSLYDAGMADSVDLFEVELSYNNSAFLLEQSLNNRRSQEILLAVLLGLEITEPISIIDKFENPKSVEEKIRSVFGNKPEIEAVRSMISVNESLLKLNKASYAPNLSMFGGYSYGRPNISPFEDDFNGNFTIGANLNWSFNFGGKTKSKVSASNFQLESSRYEYEQLNERLQKEADLVYESLKLAYTSYETALKNYDITKSSFRLAQIKNSEGVLSSNRLLEIETNLSQAESMLYSSEADYLLVLNKYNYIIGMKYWTEAIDAEIS